MFTRLLLAALTLALSSTAIAQHTGGASPAPSAPREASQADFLLGEWSLSVTPKVSGLVAAIHGVPKLVGTWKATRAFDGFGIEDELRITDGSANPKSLTHTMRMYDATARRWISTTLDVYRAQFSESTMEWKNGEMTSLSRRTDKDGKTYLARGRFTDIKPASFRFQQDRSDDDGRTWSEPSLTIDAKRTAR